MLEVQNLAVSYGRHRALEGVSLRVAKGEICVILGANGAGKSTLLEAIAGMVHAEPGSNIVMNGKAIAAMKAHRIVEEGIALVPEGRGIFGDLSVAENLQLGAFASRARAQEAAVLAEIYRLFPRLAERRKQVARTMSGGEQQMVAIGRALMSRPDILMLDEPSLGLSPLLCKELFRSLAEVAKTGVGILLVEQNAKQSLKIANRGYLIENGHVTGENTAQALMNDPAVIQAYLGGGTAAPAARAAPSRIVLPPFLRLPFGAEAMSRFVGEMAARAGRIHGAFIRALRREQAPPSAFVGRYDPKAGADPWEELAAAQPPVEPMRAPAVAADARRLSGSAANLAQRAGDRLAAHVRSKRLSTPRPAAFVSPAVVVDDTVNAPVHDAAPPLQERHGRVGHNSAGLVSDDEETARENAHGEAGLSIADLVARAGAIHTAHIAKSRKALGPFAAVDVWTPAAVSAKEPVAELVARASSIHTAHVAKQRKRLTAYTIPVQPLPAAEKNDTAKKKRKKHKET